MRNQIGDGAVAIVNDFIYRVEFDVYRQLLADRGEIIALGSVRGSAELAEMDACIAEVRGGLERHSTDGQRNYWRNDDNNDNGGQL